MYAAYEAGYAVYAITKFSDIDRPFTLPLALTASVSGLVVLGFGALGSNGPAQRPEYLAVLYNGLTWSAWFGTLARSEDIPEGVPPFTAADNDKVLGIVNGALAWVTKA